MIKLAVFDLDGTLFDTRADIVHAVNSARVSLGFVSLPFDRIVAMVGNGVSVLAGRAFADTSVAPEAALREIMKHYGPHASDSSELYAGVADTLPALRAILTVVSNKPKALIDQLLCKAGIARLFGFVAGAETFERMKPDPMALEYLRTTYGVRPREVVVVGDHAPDVQMAKNGDAWSVYCNYGFFGRDTVGADFAIDSFSELPEVIRRLDE